MGMLSLCLEVGDKLMRGNSRRSTRSPKDYLQTIRYLLHSMFLHSVKVVQEEKCCPEATATDSDDPNSVLITKSFQQSCLQFIVLAVVLNLQGVEEEEDFF